MTYSHHHGLDFYSYVSGMRQWNSTLKAIFSLVALITVIGANSLKVSMLTILYMGFLSIRIGKVHVRDYIRLLLVPLVFMLMSGIAIMIQIGGTTENCVWITKSVPMCVSVFGTHFYITSHGFWQAVSVGLKAFGAVSAMYMLTLSTPLSAILKVFRKMHVPELIIELMHLVYRYIFILSDINHSQRDAADSRLGYRNYKTSIRSFSRGLSNLLLMSLKRAEACYDAMESRGYNGELNLLEEEHAVTGMQIMWIACYILLITVSCLVWR